MKVLSHRPQHIADQQPCFIGARSLIERVDDEIEAPLCRLQSVLQVDQFVLERASSRKWRRHGRCDLCQHVPSGLVLGVNGAADQANRRFDGVFVSG